MLEPSASDGPGHFDGAAMDLDLGEVVLSLRLVWITERVLECQRSYTASELAP
jgi:hypothetical protein